MGTTTSLLACQDLYCEALVREQIDKTKTGDMTWNSAGTNTFTSTVISGDTFDFTVSKIIVGNVTSKYSLDIKKNGSALMAVQCGILCHTDRDSAVKELFEVVEIIVLSLDANLKEALAAIQGL